MQTIKRAITTGLLIGGAATVALPARADEIVVIDAVRPVLFENGGIGADEQAQMRKTAQDFNLRLTFAQARDNEFVTDVRLNIFDTAGNLVFALPSAGPMTYLRLPEGRYRIAATFKGATEIQLVNIADKQGRDLSFHWRRAAKL